jgi:hypothetical protein
MKSQNSPAKRTPHFLHPQHLTISLLARTLTQKELIMLENNPALASDPRAVLERLASDSGGEGQETGEGSKS